MTPQPRLVSRELTEDDIDTMLVPMNDVTKLIAQAVRGRDEEINALRRLVSDQAARIAELTEALERDDDSPAMH